MSRNVINSLKLTTRIPEHCRTGYPDQIAGESIPLSARIVALGDVYDALRSRRVYKVGESHANTVRCILENSPGHFDPRLLEVFSHIHEQFRVAFDECGD